MKNEFDFLKIDYPVPPVFYCLPKVHKDPLKPKGRPIVAATGSLTENISSFVDYFLQTFVKALPSFTQDSTDIIKTIKSIQDPSTVTYIACVDVESLYTSVPHNGALEALSTFLNHAYFMFKEENYLQIKGVSMGS